MEEIDLEVLVQQAAEVFAAGGSEEEILASLGTYKRLLADRAWAVSRANTLIDTLADNVRPGARWDYTRLDWTVQPVPGTTASHPKVVARAERVLEIVNAKVAAGDQTINTKEVAEQLRLEGDDKPLSSLATAVGNVLSRTEQWQRIKRNVYVPVEEV